jgi:hypothetical protein
MTLPNRAADFLCKELGVAPITQDALFPFSLTFTAFVRHIANWVKKGLNGRAIKKLYDEYVRDVIKEGRVKYAVMSSFLQSIGDADKKIRTITVTSRHLIVYDDDDNNPDQPHLHAPAGRILHSIPLIDIETRVVNSAMGKSKKFLQLTSKSRAVSSIEMSFNVNNDTFDLSSWNQAVQEAVYFTQINSNRLAKVYVQLGLSTTAEHDLSDTKSKLSNARSLSLSAQLQASFDTILGISQVNQTPPHSPLPRRSPLNNTSVGSLPGSPKLKRTPPSSRSHLNNTSVGSRPSSPSVKRASPPSPTTPRRLLLNSTNVGNPPDSPELKPRSSNTPPSSRLHMNNTSIGSPPGSLMVKRTPSPSSAPRRSPDSPKLKRTPSPRNL